MEMKSSDLFMATEGTNSFFKMEALLNKLEFIARDWKQHKWLKM